MNQTISNRWNSVPKGWMYDVRGPDGVELDLHGKPVVRIGTDEPEQLSTALSLFVAS